MKAQILRELDETGLILGNLIQQALLANDRSKYLLSLLQLAFDQARVPKPAPDTLYEERLLVGLEQTSLDTIIPNARRNEAGGFQIQGAARVLELLEQCCREMLEPLRVGKDQQASELEHRFEELSRELFMVEEESLSEKWLQRITSGSRGQEDSLHLFIMDAHRALSRIQRQLVETRIDGVSALGIQEQDRDFIRAFVEGVQRTAHLKLNHPGLDTTASRYGGRLVIQNDVGLTDSHVVVISVSEENIEITYTDIHRRRLRFFKKMLEVLRPSWKEIVTGSSSKLEEGDSYYILRGTIPADTLESQIFALNHIGSRLVFLIDWNKARRRLRNFIRNKAAVRVLARATDEEIGHMAFLKLGGEELLYEALDMAAKGYLRYGEPFHAAVGGRIAEECVGEVMRICYEGVSKGETIQMVRDRLVTAITRAFSRKTPGELKAFRRQANLVTEASLTIHSMLQGLKTGRHGRDFFERSHQRIEFWENEGDEILNRLRRNEGRRLGGVPVRDLSGALDDTLDHIDWAAFLVKSPDSLLLDKKIASYLGDLSGILVRCAQEFYKVLAAFLSHMDSGLPDDFNDFLEGVGRLDALTKFKDRLEREFIDVLFCKEGEGGMRDRAREIGNHLSRAVDSLARAEFVLYDVVFRPGRTSATGM